MGGGIRCVAVLVLLVFTAQVFARTLERDCRQDPDKGPCSKDQMRYYYNHRTRECQIFVYGGCGGNNNNFATKQECQRYCPRLFD